MKFFDTRLYRSGLSQLRLTGTILGVISLALSALPPISEWSSRKASSISYSLLSITSIAPLCIPLFYIAPVIFCLVLFRFLNNRSGSDFYHSIPHSRPSLFLSFGAAILTWLYGILCASVLFAVLLYAALGIGINPLQIPYLLLAFGAGGTLVTGALLAAMCVTGTLVTNFAVCGLILFLPRFIILLFTKTMTGALRFLSEANFGIIGNSSYNIPVALVLKAASISTSGTGGIASILTSGGAIVYTFVLGFLYLAAACVLFTFRKSETAGRSAPNRPLQHIYRIAITTPVLLLIPMMIFSNLNYRRFFTNNPEGYIAVLVVALLVYFVFEIVTTKKPENLLRAAPFFLVVVAVCFVFSGAAIFTRSAALSFNPDADDIASVTFKTGVSRYTQESDPYYNNLLTSRISFDDAAVKKQVVADLHQTVKNIESDISYDSHGRLPYYTVDIRLKNGSTVTRVLDAQTTGTEADVALINQVKEKNVDYLNDSVALPPESSVHYVTSDTDLSSHDQSSLYKTFRDEYQNLDYESKAEVAVQNGSLGTGSGSATVGYMFVSGTDGVDNYESEYLISSKMPKTLAAYIQLQNKASKANMQKYVQDLAANGTGTTSYELIGYYTDGSTGLNVGNSVTVLAQGSGGKAAVTRQIFSLVQKQMNASVHTGEAIVSVRVSVQNQSCRYFINLSGDDIKTITAFKQGIQAEKQ